MVWYEPWTWGQNGQSATNLDPSTFPTPPVPDVGATPYTGGGAYDPTVAAPSNWGSAAASVAQQNAQPASQNLADALKGLSNPGAQQHNAAPVQASLRSQTPQVSSQASRGQNSLGEVLQMLMQRQNMYGPPTYGSGGSSGGRGLLGT